MEIMMQKEKTPLIDLKLVNNRKKRGKNYIIVI
jgi:hypothetical protein